MPNFSSLAGLEVTKKFVGGRVGGFQVSTISNEVALTINMNCTRTLEISSVLESLLLLQNISEMNNYWLSLPSPL